MQTEVVILRSVINILNKAPWLTEISMGFNYKEDESSINGSQATMCTDGSTVYYHPNCLKWKQEKIEGVIVHEWLHGANLHSHRALAIPNLNHEMFNVACDATINPICRDFGWPLPDGINIPWAEAMTAEEVYWRLLRSGQSQKPKSGMLRAPSGDGPLKEGDGDGDQGDGNIPITSAVSPQRDAETKSMLARMMASARAAGKNPAGLKLAIDKWLAPKVDWVSVLREFCTCYTKDGWSYDRSHSSYRAMGLYAPGRRSRSLGPAVIVRDTSGSLYDKQREVATEARTILSQCRPSSTHVIDCDAEVHRVIELQPEDDMPEDALGGGGTDFRPVFDKVDELGIEPSVMVFITDLEGSFPDDPPNYPVLWATIGSTMDPPFGRSVTVE